MRKGVANVEGNGVSRRNVARGGRKRFHKLVQNIMDRGSIDMSGDFACPNVEDDNRSGGREIEKGS